MLGKTYISEFYHGLEHSDATQTAPSITDATYTVMREPRCPKVPALGLEPMSLLTTVLRCCPKTLSHYRHSHFYSGLGQGDTLQGLKNNICLQYRKSIERITKQ